MSPIQIEILLHHYYSPEPYDCSGNKITAGEISYLLANDMLSDRSIGSLHNASETRYKLTKKGLFYIIYILSLPLPVEKTIYSIETKD